MMTITINLPDVTVARLRLEEEAQGQTAAAIAAKAVIERFQDSDSPELDDASLRAIRQSLSEAEAGLTFSLDEASARADAALAARYGAHSAALYDADNASGSRSATLSAP